LGKYADIGGAGGGTVEEGAGGVAAVGGAGEDGENAGEVGDEGGGGSEGGEGQSKCNVSFIRSVGSGKLIDSVAGGVVASRRMSSSPGGEVERCNAAAPLLLARTAAL